jgi:sugar O-acyltransferase (sialic acid O-acetyltransferase NeuD family)
MKKLGIYGGGGFGKEVCDIALRMNDKHQVWDEIFFVVDEQYLGTKPYYGRIVSIEDVLSEFDKEGLEIIIAVGEPVVRKKLFEKVKSMGIKFATLVDPSCIISDTAELGEGVIVAPLSIVASSVVLERNVAINTMTTIGHDIKIGAHTVISTHVTIGGSSTIGEETFIGLGAQTKQELSIGKNVIVGMGSVVFNDIPEKIIAMGNPARPSRRNDGNLVFKSKKE